MKPRAQSVGALLEPWVAAFSNYGHATATYTTSPSTGRVVATIELVLSTLEAAFVSYDDAIVLREALEVLHLAAVVDAASVEAAVSELCYHSFEQPEDEDEITKDVQGKNQATSSCHEIQFVLTFFGTAGHFLESVVAPAFFTDRNARSSEYLATRAELLNGETLDRALQLNCRCNLVSMDGDFEDVLEPDYLQHVVTFIQTVDQAAKDADVGSNQDTEYDGTTIRVSAVNLELNELAINSETMAIVTSLKAVSIPVLCSRVAIDPRTLACSSNELTQFLESIGAHSTKMTVDVGHVTTLQAQQTLDGNGENQDELIETIFRGVAGANCVSTLSFGPLLAMMSSPENRRSIWTELFASLASKSSESQLTSLVLSPQIELLEEDAVYIEEAAGRQLAGITSVRMWLSQSAPRAVQAFIEAVGRSTEKLTLHSEPHAMTTTETVSTIVRVCPELKRLAMTSAQVESMAVFMEKTTPLHELSLSSVTVTDTKSTNAFLSVLADKTTLLAKNLRKLHVKVDNNSMQTTTLDEEQCQLVEALLQSNEVLNDVELTIADGVATRTVFDIQAHDKEVLAESLPLANKLAFVSAMLPSRACGAMLHRNRVDEDVIRHIFEFAAERVSRQVQLEY